MNNISYDFSGQRVLVTGGGRGIGLAIAQGFAKAGAEVFALDLSFISEADQGVRQFVCDVTDTQKVRDLVSGLIREHGPITTLINNAGSDQRIAFGDMTEEDWRWMLDVNISHFPVFGQTVRPAMIEAGGGAIINLSSSAWMKMAGNLTAYHSAKAGIMGLTRGMARDLGQEGIRVNAIAPGRVVTERTNVDDPDWVAETKTLQCIPELALADDIAQAAMWLASEGSRMVTGQTLVVDGGVV
ncbi:SDR family NAD(P)-dependent oxidoreductase [Halocynthiibacter sp. C4]|uniref:SDR family NAD(P)-dependent oxidoreductase n=1 Tax=Halocynthiibacter sp. C4 TaxID=2992758 RepID=UPI00237C161D|nr:SDR family NAD(P)-dependent oxidoreductase [Halocynthiibacter sp. C4]MDE0591565.1 SDR family NAD(P)-dependent oxidoreductase [Halocynthiibacter sp. C4]